MSIESRSFASPGVEIDQIDRFGWSEDILNCRFPVKCELSFDPETQKPMLTVSIQKDDPGRGQYYALDVPGMASDLEVMGYLEKGKTPEFIYEMTINNPDPKVLNYMDGQGETMNGFIGEFELGFCQGTEKDVCALVTDSEDGQVIARVPVYPINELEFSMRQRNIEIHDYPTQAAKDYLLESALGAFVVFSVAVGSMIFIKSKIENLVARDYPGQLHSLWGRNTEKAKAVLKNLTRRRR